MSYVQGILERAVGVEVGKHELTAVYLDENRQVMGQTAVDVRVAEPATSQLVSFISDLKSSFGDFERVGVAVPGLVDRAARTVAFSAHIPEHSGKDLGVEIERETGLKIFLENDANAAGYGEFKLGAGRGAENMFYATIGAGVGGSFIFDGNIWRGVRGFAGEFGYVPINSDGQRLEDVASSANLIRRTRNRFHQDSTSSLVDIDEREIKTRDIIAAAAADDDFAKLMLERTGTYVGTAIASVINLTNIERIVVGGEILRDQTVVIDAIVARAHELSFAPSFASATILVGELRENAAATGAALLAQEAKQPQKN